MLLNLPLPMCRAGNKAGDGWMKGIPIDTSNCGGALSRLLNRLFTTWENELELPVWPMWLRAIMAPYFSVCGRQNALGPYLRHLRRLTGQDFTSNGVIGETNGVFFFSANKNDCLRVEGFPQIKEFGIFHPTFGAPMCRILSLQVHMFHQLELWPRVRSSFVKVVVDEEQRFNG